MNELKMTMATELLSGEILNSVKNLENEQKLNPIGLHTNRGKIWIVGLDLGCFCSQGSKFISHILHLLG